MKPCLFATESSPSRAHRFLLPLELKRLAQMLGTHVECISIHTHEQTDVVSLNPSATEGGIIIPLHGRVSVRGETNGQTVDINVPVSVNEGPFNGFLVNHDEPVQVSNLEQREARVLCISGNAFPLLNGASIGTTRTAVATLFSQDPEWIYVNNMSRFSGPSGNHYHVNGHELHYPIHGRFAVTLKDLSSMNVSHHTLMADAELDQHQSLHIAPLTAHAIEQRGKTEPLSRLLVISTARPRTQDTFEHILVPSA